MRFHVRIRKAMTCYVSHHFLGERRSPRRNLSPCPVEKAPVQESGVPLFKGRSDAWIFFFFKKKSLQSLHTRQFILDLWLIGALKAVIFKYKSLVFHYPICAIDITFIMGINRSSPETKLSFGATPYSKVGNMRGFRINYASLSWSSLLTRKLIFSTTIVNCMVFEYV